MHSWHIILLICDLDSIRMKKFFKKICTFPLKKCLLYFQNLNLTWYTTDPQFTDCFQQSVLAWIPCAFLWLFAVIDVHTSLTSRSRNIPWTALNISKISIITILMIFQIIELAYHVYLLTNNYSIQSVERYTPIVRILTFVRNFLSLIYYYYYSSTTVYLLSYFNCCCRVWHYFLFCLERLKESVHLEFSFYFGLSMLYAN